jgi:nicotinamidase/pyrazinamidase
MMTDFTLIPGPGDALLLVDVQNDFLPGGSLAVKEGDRVVMPLNRCIELFSDRHLPIFATRDWHPANHCSFVGQGGRWPPHCVAGTPGADFAPDLRLPADLPMVKIGKGNDPAKDSYSGFVDTELELRLGERAVKRLFVGGLATDYCVLNTVLDALKRGYLVVVLSDAIRAVEVNPGDGERALAAMKEMGALLVETGELA